jgi:peptidoglycan/LPS O-acetylase OafA/YrhL
MGAAMFGGETIGQRLTATRGRTTGFDYLRAGLSISVIAFHSVLTSYGEAYTRVVWNGWWRPFIAVILPAFFALSGFLVSASLVRSKTIQEFLTLRVVRLVPALFFEVTISALILGPLLTVFTLRDYFASPLFRAYWLNIVGYIHFQLPGLFRDNPDPNMVNRQLWTIPVELKCYLAITGISLIGFSRKKWRMLALLALCIAAFPVIDLAKGQDPFGIDNVPAKVMIESFLAGVTIFLFKDDLPLSRGLFLLSAALTFLCLSNRYASYVASIPTAYLTVYLGLTNTPRTLVSRIGDYSYGLYIYGYAIQQAYAFLFPGFRIWWANIAASLTVAFLCAALSWHLLEKPVLENRKHAVAAVEKAVSFAGRRLKALMPAQRRAAHRKQMQQASADTDGGS